MGANSFIFFALTETKSGIGNTTDADLSSEQPSGTQTKSVSTPKPADTTPSAAKTSKGKHVRHLH